jgi:hypothetical protein
MTSFRDLFARDRRVSPHQTPKTLIGILWLNLSLLARGAIATPQQTEAFGGASIALPSIFARLVLPCGAQVARRLTAFAAVQAWAASSTLRQAFRRRHLAWRTFGALGNAGAAI